MSRTQYLWKKGSNIITCDFPARLRKMANLGWIDLGHDYKRALEKLRELSEEDWQRYQPKVIEVKTEEPEVKDETEEIKRGRGRPRKYPLAEEDGA